MNDPLSEVSHVDPFKPASAHSQLLRQACGVVLGLFSLVLLLFVLVGADLSALFLLFCAFIGVIAAVVLWRAPRAMPSVDQRLASEASFLASAPAPSESDDANLDDLRALLGGDLLTGAISGRYEILYEDSKGAQATRTIAVYAIVERADAVNLDCFSADQISCRTYRADRIIRLRDLDSGEVVENDIVSWLTQRA